MALTDVGPGRGVYFQRGVQHLLELELSQGRGRENHCLVGEEDQH